MKKLLFLCGVLITAQLAVAAAANTQTVQPVQPATRAEQKKAFKARKSQIRQLLKAYQKAPEAQKPAIKAQLTQVVSQSMDAALAYMKARVNDEQANLDNWKAKIASDEANLPALKAQRVEDLLSGEAKRKYKAAKKAWKKQFKSLKK